MNDIKIYQIQIIEFEFVSSFEIVDPLSKAYSWEKSIS